MSVSSQKVEKDLITADEWVPIFLEMLKEGHKLKIAPHGHSMYPFLISDRDEVMLVIPDRELRRGDVVLYRRDNGIHVLHRIHHINKKGYYMIGDSQTEIEGPLLREQILAVADTIIRKGKVISCDSKRYLFLYRLWIHLRLFRPFIIRAWLIIRKLSGEDKREKIYL